MWSLVPTDCFLFQTANVCQKYYKLFIHVELKLDSGFQYHTRTHFIRRFNSILQLVLFTKSSMDSFLLLLVTRDCSDGRFVLVCLFTGANNCQHSVEIFFMFSYLCPEVAFFFQSHLRYYTFLEQLILFKYLTTLISYHCIIYCLKVVNGQDDSKLRFHVDALSKFHADEFARLL